MSTKVLLQQEPQAGGRGRRTESTPAVQVLQKCYETATFPLAEHFPLVDQWLAEHAPDLWRQIRQEDDELFRLRQLGVPLQTYQAKLDAFVSLCEQAERLYAEMQPALLGFPPLAPGERVAVYCELNDGTLLKVSGEHE